MNTWKNNLEETKQRYVKWWNHEGIILNMWEHFQEGVKPHADIPMPLPPRDLEQKWFDPQWRSQYLDWYVAHSCLKADMLPVANTQLGPGSLAAILGGVFQGGEDTIWIHPNPHFTDDFRFDSTHPNWLLHKDLLKECKKKSQGHYYVGMPDLMEGLDVLAALKGTNQVLLDTVMQPEVVERQMQYINDVYFEVFDTLYDIIREGDEMAFCYFSSWAPGKMTKLQSDISTMISTDDYRRFVQPFIREQCQKIDYTLYHLDGVGAIRHLPALLEISELNAIQWTPGVGQPQGGSPQWYSLYRQILEAGKSVMACWVSLDELRPLLNHIGGQGVHLEMDFHNEQEVDMALEIVAEFQKTMVTAIPTIHPRKSIASQSDKKILILDGGMGTMIQRYHLQENDFRGHQFASHPVSLQGCNDLLSITRPDIISEIHRKYLKSGADFIETNTFSAQRISMADFGLEDYCRDINIAACRVAREAALQFSTTDHPRYVLGSIGPTSKICSMPTGDQPPLSTDLLSQAYQEQIEALIDGGVDALLIETIFDTLNAQVAIDAARKVMENKGVILPIMLSFSVATPDGKNMLGQSITDFLSTIDLSGIFSVGINCVTDVKTIEPLLIRMGEMFPVRISLYPNAGMPNTEGMYDKSPDSLLADVWPLIEGHYLNILGGCCGTTDDFIHTFSSVIQPAPGLFISPHVMPGKVAKAYKTYRPSVASKSRVPRESHSSQSTNPPLFDAILHGRVAAAEEAAREALNTGASPQQLLDKEMIGAMSLLGKQFEEGKAFVPQLLMAGRAMKAALSVLGNSLSGGERAIVGKVVIGTVKGDLHDIGKNLVASMLEGCGFDVVNIGIDVSAERFVEEVRRHQPDILCMSALLTTTMTYMSEVIKALEQAGLRGCVKIMVGGAPVTQQFANKIGADGYADNANSAVSLAKSLISTKTQHRK